MSRQVRRRGAAMDASGSGVAVPSWEGAPHSCGGVFRLVRKSVEIPIRGSNVRIEQEFYRCSKCGEEQLDLNQVDTARRAAARKLNQDEGLLQAEEIRALRESFGLTQAEFEQAVGIGPKTMVRWETGKVLPGQAMAMLLLLIQRDPSALCFLASKRGVKLDLEVGTPAFVLHVSATMARVTTFTTELLNRTGDWPIASPAVAA